MPRPVEAALAAVVAVAALVAVETVAAIIAVVAVALEALAVARALETVLPVAAVEALVAPALVPAFAAAIVLPSLRMTGLVAVLAALLALAVAFGAHAGLRGVGWIDHGLVAVLIVAILVLLLPEGPLRTVVLAVLLAQLLMRGQHDADIVLGVLVVALGADRIAAGGGVARELHVLLRDGLRVSAHLHVRPVRLVGAGQGVGALVAAAAVVVAVAAAHAPVLAWSHRACLDTWKVSLSPMLGMRVRRRAAARSGRVSFGTGGRGAAVTSGDDITC